MNLEADENRLNTRLCMEMYRNCVYKAINQKLKYDTQAMTMPKRKPAATCIGV